MGVSLFFCLSRNAANSTIRRTPAAPRVKEIKLVPDSDESMKTGKGKRKDGAKSPIKKKTPSSKTQVKGNKDVPISDLLLDTGKGNQPSSTIKKPNSSRKVWGAEGKGRELQQERRGGDH